MPKFFRSAEHKAVQDILREMRLAAGLNQSDLAAMLGQSQSYVSKYENGDRVLDFLEVRHLCKVLGKSLSAFAEEIEVRINES